MANKAYINFEEYDRLKSLGYTDKRIAKMLGVSPRTVCVRLKERKQHGCIKSNGNTL